MITNAAAVIVPTDISTMVREVETAYSRYLSEFKIPEDHKIVVNYSAGKDSTATLAVAHSLFGDRVQAVMVDTDNEHELTVQFAKTIHEQIGCAPVKVVKRIYTEADFERRRSYIQKNWVKRQAIRMGAYRGVVMPSLGRSDTAFGQAWLRTAERWGIEFETALEAALSVMHPSGNVNTAVAQVISAGSNQKICVLAHVWDATSQQHRSRDLAEVDSGHQQRPVISPGCSQGKG